MGTLNKEFTFLHTLGNCFLTVTFRKTGVVYLFELVHVMNIVDPDQSESYSKLTGKECN